jgi:hypothetical protein
MELQPILQQRFPQMVSLRSLKGNHLTPLSQEIQWQVGEMFTPIDAIGQWINQGISRNLYRLKKEILIWLNPISAF